MPSVVQQWVSSLPYMQQTVLLTAVRGPDTVRKFHPVKTLQRWMRRCILISAVDGRILMSSDEPGGGGFMGPCKDPNEDIHSYRDAFARYIELIDEVPHHFQLHFLHAAEILGYKHPSPAVSGWWCGVYRRLVADMHLRPETASQLDIRLGDVGDYDQIAYERAARA